MADHIEISIVSRAQQADQIVAHCSAASLVETIRKGDIANPAILFLTWTQIATDRDADTSFTPAHDIGHDIERPILKIQG